VRAIHVPRVVLTSNAARELSDALKRRCLHLYIDFPTPQRELEIVRSRVPGVSEQLARKVVAAVQAVRKLDLKKPPSISETLDWVRALTLLNASTLERRSSPTRSRPSSSTRRTSPGPRSTSASSPAPSSGKPALPVTPVEER